MRKRTGMMLVIALGIMTAFVSRPAAAVDMTWTMRSTYDYKISLSFYSQEAKRSWPGPGEIYVLADSKPHSFKLVCRRGENICYGAWPTGGSSTKFWGVGRDSAHRCKTCCFVCGQSNPSRELTD